MGESGVEPMGQRVSEVHRWHDEWQRHMPLPYSRDRQLGKTNLTSPTFLYQKNTPGACTSGVLVAADYSNTFPVDFAVERHAIPVSMTTLKFPLIATCKRYKIFQVLGCLVIQTIGPRHEIPVYLSSCLSCLHHICQLLGTRCSCVSW